MRKSWGGGMLLVALFIISQSGLVEDLKRGLGQGEDLYRFHCFDKEDRWMSASPES